MHLFFAAVSGNSELLDRLDRPNVLTSYVEGWNPDKSKVSKIFLDSGAFTAFNTGKVIDVSDYTDYCLKNGHKFDVVCALDVIGDPQASHKNYKYMKGSGLDVLPVFHIGDDWKWYYKLLDEYEFVAIGGLAWRVSSGTASERPLMRAMIKCHKLAQKNNVRLHGFGVTKWKWVKNFPWYSVDSSTYLVGARFGHILTFQDGVLGRRLRPNTRGLSKERRRLADYLPSCGFEHNYSVDDLLPVGEAGRKTTLNMLHFNCLVMQYAFSKLN